MCWVWMPLYASLGCSFHPMQVVDSLKTGGFPPTTKKHKQIIKLTVVVKLGITPNLMAIQNFPPNVPSVFFRLAFLGGVTWRARIHGDGHPQTRKVSFN